MRRVPPYAALVVGLCAVAAPASADDATRWAATYADAVEKVNAEHARKPGRTLEKDLAARLPADARAALARVLEAKASGPVHDALLRCGEAALDLDLADDFGKVRARLERESDDHARRLGRAVFRERFVLRGLGLEAAYLERVADLIDAVLDAYHDVFAFEEWSKVPGKKLRLRFHLEPKPGPPHFAPELPHHSEVDFPVEDGSSFRSPTPDGKFLLYGLCHELGHVIAMWGDAKNEEDRHAWAHYTGVAIVEHLSSKKPTPPAVADLRDVRWRSLEIERKQAKDVPPGLEKRENVLSLLVALHDAVDPKAIGAAINLLDRKDQRLRIHGVRYYTFAELRSALLEVVKGKAERKAVERLLP